MIEAIIRNFLLNVVDVPVYVTVPAEPADSYVVVERTGGGVDEHIRRATIAVQSYGVNREQAATLHETILAELPAIADGDKVSACYVNAEYSYTDEATKKYRYQSVFDITYY